MCCEHMYASADTPAAQLAHLERAEQLYGRHLAAYAMAAHGAHSGQSMAEGSKSSFSGNSDAASTGNANSVQGKDRGEIHHSPRTPNPAVIVGVVAPESASSQHASHSVPSVSSPAKNDSNPTGSHPVSEGGQRYQSAHRTSSAAVHPASSLFNAAGLPEIAHAALHRPVLPSPLPPLTLNGSRRRFALVLLQLRVLRALPELSSIRSSNIIHWENGALVDRSVKPLQLVSCLLGYNFSLARLVLHFLG